MYLLCYLFIWVFICLYMLWYALVWWPFLRKCRYMYLMHHPPDHTSFVAYESKTKQILLLTTS